MKNVFKKWAGIILLVAVILCGLLVWNNSTYAVTSVTASGTHGSEDVEWTLYSDGALVISGSGHINIYQYKAP